MTIIYITKYNDNDLLFYNTVDKLLIFINLIIYPLYSKLTLTKEAIN